MAVRLARLAWLVVSVSAVVGCHHAPPPETNGEMPTGEIAVQVVNHNFADMVIYLLDNGVRNRLGTAYAAGTGVFFIPWARVASNGTLRLIADLIGGTRSAVTDRLTVRPGSMVVWTIENVLAQSSVGVY
jgi:hypothetical protein